jgi:uncharacterized protein YaaR (DUF327 family)
MYIRKIFLLLSVFVLQQSIAQSIHQTALEVGKVDKIYHFDGNLYEVYDAELFFPKSLEVSSTLANEEGMYDKSHLIDYNPGTVWVEGVKGNGVGETMTFRFNKKELPYIISFEPGFMKSDQTWNKNNRVAAFELRFMDTKKRTVTTTNVDFLGEGLMVYSGTYAANFSSLFEGTKRMASVEYLEVTITKVDDKGTKFSDTCVSGLTFYKRKTKKPVQKITEEAYQAITTKK